MFTPYLRASTIGTYLDCEFKYFLQYYCELPDKSGKKANMGTIVHHAAEILAKAKKNNHHLLKDKYTNPDYLIQICWDKYTKKIYKDMEWTEKDFDFCKKMLHLIVNSNQNPLRFDIFKTEHQFDIEVKMPGFKNENGANLHLRGTIDLICKSGDDTLHVRDWKTGERKCWIKGTPKELPDFQKDIQLRVYDLALSILFPEYKYRMFTIIYVRDGGPFTVTFSDEERAETIAELSRIFSKIKNNTSPSRLIDDKLRSSQHWKCRYVCTFGKEKDPHSGKSLCEKYYEILSHESNLGDAKKFITALTINNKPAEASRRNDYSRDKIHRAILE